MGAETVDPAHQAFILARLSDFCRYQAKMRRWERDPWHYMRETLLKLEPALSALKAELLAATRARLIARLKAGPLVAGEAADFRQLLEGLLTRGDFADAAIHIDPAAGPQAAESVARALSQAQPHHAFVEERKPAEERNPSWEKLVAALSSRLELDLLAEILRRKKRTPQRKALILRRLRRNVAEYCAVMRIPTEPSETISPFMLPRLEALIAACLRFLNRYR